MIYSGSPFRKSGGGVGGGDGVGGWGWGVGVSGLCIEGTKTQRKLIVRLQNQFVKVLATSNHVLSNR